MGKSLLSVQGNSRHLSLTADSSLADEWAAPILIPLVMGCYHTMPSCRSFCTNLASKELM